jgi:hypothetical protein
MESGPPVFTLLFSGNLVGNELVPKASAGIAFDFDLITSSWWTNACFFVLVVLTSKAF